VLLILEVCDQYSVCVTDLCVLTLACRRYLNPYFHSSYDNGTYVDVEPIAATAVVLARALHALAAPTGAPALKVISNWG
jgi:hypothetical protein